MKNNQNIDKIPELSPENLYWQQIILWSESIKPSTLPEDLITHYVTACYQAWVGTTLPIALRIGQHSALLAALMQTTGSRCAVYVTACNPGSQVLSSIENSSATTRLRAQLIRYSPHIYRGESINSAGEWPAETSFLVLGIDSATAGIIGRKFNQNAIVYAATDAIPRLVLLR